MFIDQRALRAALLCGSAAIVATPSFAADQVAAAAPVEEILITGSLITGAEAVGIPVTSVGAEEFRETGALTVSDLLRSVPAVQVVASTSITNAGSAISRGTGVDIHGMNSNTSPRTLMMIDGLRYPPMAHGTSFYDPSIIPQLAVQRVDVLANGASATYGSDAVAGVINVILRRGYDGAITQGRYGRARGGDAKRQFSQLYGRTWDGGGITLTYELYVEDALPATERIDILTYDYTPWGLDNRTPVNSSVPATVSTGRPNVTTGTTCSNCFSVPKGQNGVGLTWATLQANKGVFNEVSPYTYADTTSAQQRNAATLTFDQEIFPGVELFVDGFYSNRRAQIRYPSTVNPASAAGFTHTVPTSNPYFPVGAPTGINVSYNLSAELTPRLSSYQLSESYRFGVNLTSLPYGWNGKLAYQVSQEGGDDNVEDLTNTNMVRAALGDTVAAAAASGTVPGQAAYTKPANIPFLNPFCDPEAFTCNDPQTLRYIAGYRRYDHTYLLHEYQAIFDGPVFMLPGGEVLAAVGANYTDHSFQFTIRQNFNSHSNALVSTTPDNQDRQVWAVFGQLNVPVVGEMNRMPGIWALEVEGSVRYDRYNDFGGTTNPKISANWDPIEGLTLRGAWGTSFRAPSFADMSSVTVQIHGVNQLGGVNTNTHPACATIGGTPVPGSAAASLNPTCSGDPALRFPGGMSIRGGVGGVAFMREAGQTVGPETAKNLSLGFDFNPTFLAGFNLYATYFKIDVEDLLQGFDETAGDGLNDSGLGFTYIMRDNPNFDEYLLGILRHPNSQAPLSVAPQISWIVDGGIRNIGEFAIAGFDFGFRYDHDLGNFGGAHAGLDGTYFLYRKSTAFPGAETDDAYDFNGQAREIRLRYRAQLGWNMDNYSANLFMNYQSHYFHNNAFPPAQYLANFPNYSNLQPNYITFDLSLGYNTLDDFAATSPYLNDLDFRFVVNNALDNMPPFMYRIGANLGNPAAFDISLSPIGRQWTFVVTKTW